MAKDTKKKGQALPEAEETAAPPKRSKKKRIIIILFLLLLTLVGAGAGGYWWFFIHKPGEALFSSKKADAEAPVEEVAQEEQKKGEAAKKEEAHDSSATLQRPHEIPRGKSVVVPLPVITVNIFEGGGHRYLKIGMEVEANRDISKEIKENEARVRDAVIMLLAGKTYREIASPEGKVMLKVEVMSRLNQILGSQWVTRVYFTDFVVQ